MKIVTLGFGTIFGRSFFSSKDDVDKIQLQYSDLQKTWNHTTDWKLLEGNNGFWVKRETELGLSLDFNLESHAQMYLICLSQSRKKGVLQDINNPRFKKLSLEILSKESEI